MKASIVLTQKHYIAQEIIKANRGNNFTDSDERKIWATQDKQIDRGDVFVRLCRDNSVRVVRLMMEHFSQSDSSGCQNTPIESIYL